MDDKRFIEESFPVKEVSVESAREKNIRHGHISTLHIWWARRPLASSRATNYAALIPPPRTAEEWNKQRNFIIELSKWENSLNKQIIEKAREDILKANGGKPSKVLDPFGGGGAIPLEALRLGCEVYSNDYNPVAVLIQKCTLEYPQKYGKKIKRKVKDANGGLFEQEVELNPLVEDIKKWGKWVLKEAKKEIAQFYPSDPDGSIPVAYIWARTIPCQNPSCGAEIPLMRQFWLAKKSNKRIAIFPYAKKKEIKFKIVGTVYERIPQGFNPDKGTVSKAVVNCPICGSVVDAVSTRRIFREGKCGSRLVAVISANKGIRGKTYRVATERDLECIQKSQDHLVKIRKDFIDKYGFDPIPEEELPINDSLGFRIQNYGIRKWGDIFNPRQKLAMVVFCAKLRILNEILDDSDYSKAIISYLSLVISKLASTTNVLCRWNNGAIAGKPDQFGTLEMKMDYPENNPFSNSSGCFENHVTSIASVYINQINTTHPVSINLGSAISLPYPDCFFDAVFTDPPYYDNIGYAALSDFFYVWLKRMVGDLYPALFSTPLTPKKGEIIQNTSASKTKKFFEDSMSNALKEIERVLKENGIIVMVYAHKSTEGWETLINSLMDSGLVVTASWPLDTERKGRQRAQESAALGSSIYIVARKMQRQSAGIYNNVKEELKSYLKTKLDRLWQEGIGGADFFIAAIGSAIEVFGKYEKVMDYEGNIIRADRMLDDVRQIATDYAVHQILHNGFASGISDMTRFYVLFRWNYGETKVVFDEARKLAQSCGIDLAQEWNKGFIKKQKEFIKILGPHERDLEELETKTDIIDVLHRVLLLWEKGRRVDLIGVLKDTGYGNNDTFYRVAQAISESLSKESKEKKLLDGMLAGRERIQQEAKKESGQRRFF